MSQPLFARGSEGIRLLAVLKPNFRRAESPAVGCDPFEAKSGRRVNEHVRSFGPITSHGHNQIGKNLSFR